MLNDLFIDIGNNNYISLKRVISIVAPDSSPIKRVIQEAKKNNMLIDASMGRATKSVIIFDSNHIVLSYKEPVKLYNDIKEGKNE